MAQLRRTIVNAQKAPQPIGAYSQAVRVKVAELLFLAGQVSLDARGNLVGEGDVAAQTRQAFENLGHVLEEAGASFGNVVEFTTYLVGRGAVQPFLQARTELFPELFPKSEFPPNTLLIVSGLVRPELLVEIKAIAALQ